MLPGLRELYDAYSFNVIPQIGRRAPALTGYALSGAESVVTCKAGPAPVCAHLASWQPHRGSDVRSCEQDKAAPRRWMDRQVLDMLCWSLLVQVASVLGLGSGLRTELGGRQAGGQRRGELPVLGGVHSEVPRAGRVCRAGAAGRLCRHVVRELERRCLRHPQRVQAVSMHGLA